MSYSPIADPQGYQMRQDKEHLNLLAIFHYIMGALTILSGLGLLAYALVGAVVFKTTSISSTETTPIALAGVMMTFGIIGTMLCGLVGVLMIYAGRCLSACKGQPLIYAMAVLNCLNPPLGLTLGVCTFIVMSRPTVKALFDPQFAMASAETSSPNGNPPWYHG